MSVREIVEVLQTSWLGTDLDTAERQRLAAIMRVRQFADGEIVVAEGASEHCLDLLLSGELGVVDGKTGNTVYILRPGEFAGAMDFLDGQPRKSSLRAIGGARVATLERVTFESLIDKQPRLIYHVLRAIVRTLHRILLKMDDQCAELTNYVYRQHGRY